MLELELRKAAITPVFSKLWQTSDESYSNSPEFQTRSEPEDPSEETGPSWGKNRKAVKV